MSIALAAGLIASISNVPMFEWVQLDDDLAVTPMGIIQDTRCPDTNLCFRPNVFRVAAVIEENGRRRAVVLDWDRPIYVQNGELRLVSAGTPAIRNGAIRLENYRLSLEYSPAG